MSLDPVVIAGWLERGSQGAVRASVIGTIALLALLVGYLASGFTLLLFDPNPFPYPFLAVDADPVFNLLMLLAGSSICLGTGGLILLHSMKGVRSVYDMVAVLCSFIGFGFGVASIRGSYPMVHRSIIWLLDSALSITQIVAVARLPLC
jgi:hypothetical protein